MIFSCAVIIFSAVGRGCCGATGSVISAAATEEGEMMAAGTVNAARMNAGFLIGCYSLPPCVNGLSMVF